MAHSGRLPGQCGCWPICFSAGVLAEIPTDNTTDKQSANVVIKHHATHDLHICVISLIYLCNCKCHPLQHVSSNQRRYYNTIVYTQLSKSYWVYYYGAWAQWRSYRTSAKWINSLAAGRAGCHFKTAIFNLVFLLIGFFRSSNDCAPRWMQWDLMDDKLTLVQVMAWCRQATSHYLSQCWPSSMLPYGVTRPQWVNTLWSSDAICRHRNSVNIGSGNSVSPDGTKPLLEPMLTYHQ